MVRTHYIVGCGDAKRDEPAEARDLYTSGYFAGKRKLAEADGSFWYVLSAKHGIIPCDHVIEPYDVSASDVPEDVLRDRVESTIDDGCGTRWSRVDRVVVLAGKDYVEPTRDIFEDRIDADVEFPFQDNPDISGMFDQSEWLSTEAKKATNTGVDDYV